MTTAKDFAKYAPKLQGPTVLDLLTRLRALVDAADGVVANWSEGDLAGAVNTLEAAADDARALLEHKAVTAESIKRATGNRI